MGFNSWNSFGIGVTEEQITAVADYMSLYLKDYGWEYIVVDAGWYHASYFETQDWNTVHDPPQSIDEYGRLLPDVVKFPSSANGKGFKPLADYVHSKGLKFGIHIMRGIPWNSVANNTPIKGTQYTAADIAEFNNLCEWTHVTKGIDMTHPGGDAYYQSLMELYCEWGVDYIKADDMSRPYRVDEIEAFSRAVSAAPRDILVSLSPGGAPLMAARHLREHAHLWRISGDFWDTWPLLRKMFDLCRLWEPYVQPHHWPDADMLPLGKLRKNGVSEWEASLHGEKIENLTDEYARLSKDEQYTLMNLWAIFRSPLMMGGYLPENDEFTLELLTNKDMIRVNQYSAGNREVAYGPDWSIWTADDPETGHIYAALFNLGETERELSLQCDEIGATRGVSEIKDLWTKEVLNTVNDSISVILSPHQSVLLRITLQ